MLPLAARLPRPGPAALPLYWQSADGDQASIDLSGTGPGSITTSLSTLSGWTSGATYRVSFSLAANPDNTLSPQSCVRATTASSQQDYCFNVLNTDGQGTPASTANMGWQRHTFEFTGAPTDHLTFTSLDAPGDGWGPALDNITVEKLVPTTGPGVRHLFTGKERDGETGLDYFGARYLSAAQGRFTSADAPFADQFAENPQSWNLYSYTRNSPLKYVDPDGRRVQICITGGLRFDVEDGDYINLEAGNPGVVLPEFRFGRDQLSIGVITCGGTACGTATYVNDDPGIKQVLLPLDPIREQLALFNPHNWMRAGVKMAAKDVKRQATSYHPPPATLPGFPNAKQARRKTPVQGGGGFRKRWKDDEAIYEWDSQHGTVEKYDKSGRRHLGEFDPRTGAQVSPPDPTRSVDR